MALNRKIIYTAREWINTPFVLHGRKKQVGCDCIGLFIGIAQELNLRNKYGDLISSLDNINYALLGNHSKLEKILDQNLEINIDITPGSLALLKFDANPEHVGIIGTHLDNKLTIIHSNLRLKKVVEQHLTTFLKNKIIKFYTINS